MNATARVNVRRTIGACLHGGSHSVELRPLRPPRPRPRARRDPRCVWCSARSLRKRRRQISHNLRIGRQAAARKNSASAAPAWSAPTRRIRRRSRSRPRSTCTGSAGASPTRRRWPTCCASCCGSSAAGRRRTRGLGPTTTCTSATLSRSPPCCSASRIGWPSAASPAARAITTAPPSAGCSASRRTRSSAAAPASREPDGQRLARPERRA